MNIYRLPKGFTWRKQFQLRTKKLTVLACFMISIKPSSLLNNLLKLSKSLVELVMTFQKRMQNLLYLKIFLENPHLIRWPSCEDLCLLFTHMNRIKNAFKSSKNCFVLWFASDIKRKHTTR